MGHLPDMSKPSHSREPGDLSDVSIVSIVREEERIG